MSALTPRTIRTESRFSRASCVRRSRHSREKLYVSGRLAPTTGGREPIQGLWFLGSSPGPRVSPSQTASEGSLGAHVAEQAGESQPSSGSTWPAAAGLGTWEGLQPGGGQRAGCTQRPPVAPLPSDSWPRPAEALLASRPRQPRGAGPPCRGVCGARRGRVPNREDLPRQAALPAAPVCPTDARCRGPGWGQRLQDWP